MQSGKKILVIIGSATRNSSNQKLMEQVLKQYPGIDFQSYDDLSILPHFDTSLTDSATPEEVVKIRKDIDDSAGVFFPRLNISSVSPAD